MCKLSHQLKLCTCGVSDVSELEHYWVLHENNVFDVELNVQNGDRLQLTFRCSEPAVSGQPEIKVITYGYTWRAGRWTEETFDPLSWQEHHDPAMTGELDPTLDTDDVARRRR